MKKIVLLICVLTFAHLFPEEVLARPAGGALDGERYRIFVTTDIPADTDDIQSLAHLLVTSHLFDIEGITTSPPRWSTMEDRINSICGSSVKRDCILRVIDAYAEDYQNLLSYDSAYPTPAYLRSIATEGNRYEWERGRNASDGSRHIIERAHADDSRPLYVLVWGTATTIAQALRDDPSIVDNIRVIFVGWSNTNKDYDAYYSLRDNEDLWLIDMESTFAGVNYPNTGGDIMSHVRGHGALGDYWYTHRSNYVDRDFATVYYLMAGNPDNPTGEHWGGQFQPWRDGNKWIDLDRGTLDGNGRTGAPRAVNSINRWSNEYLAHLREMMDRAATRNTGTQTNSNSNTTNTTSPQNDTQTNSTSQNTTSSNATAARYEVIEFPLTASRSYNNGYRDMSLEAVFTSPDGRKYTVPGFWDGGDTFKVRFAADRAGTWEYEFSSNPNDSGLNQSGRITVSNETAGHGYVRADGRYFSHDDGTPYLMFGNTYYGLIQHALGGGNWKVPLDQSRSHGINKIRMSFFPWWDGAHYRFEDDPEYDRWPERSPFRGSHNEIDLQYWTKMDEVIEYMGSIGMHSDLIVFTDEPRAYGSEAQDRRFIKEVVARYAAYPHVIWCITNEWEKTDKNASYWRRMGAYLADTDPWFNPRGAKRALGIHQITTDTIQFRTDNWLGHTIIQFGVWNKRSSHGDVWASHSIRVADNYNRPAVNDEYGYMREPDLTANNAPLTRTKHRNAMWAIFTSGAAGASAGSHYTGGGNGYHWNNGTWKDAPEYDDIKILMDTFIEKDIAFWKMRPVNVSGGRVYGIGQAGTEYIIYDANGGTNSITLPQGSYTLSFLNVTNGTWTTPTTIQGGNRTLHFAGERAALIRRSGYTGDAAATDTSTTRSSTNIDTNEPDNNTENSNTSSDACHYYNLSNISNFAVTGVGIPVNVFTSNLISSASCSNNTVFMKIHGDATTYTWSQGYYWKNNAWTPVTYTGTTVNNSDWIQGMGSGMTSYTPNQTGAYIHYTCLYRDSSFYCGCRNPEDVNCKITTANGEGRWTLQVVKP